MESYLYLMGIKPSRELHLAPHVVLQPTSCNPLPDDMIDSIMKHGSRDETDLGILIATLKKTTAQLKIITENPKDLAILSWNIQWDAVLLSALLNCEVYWHVQSNIPAERFSSQAHTEVVLSSRLFLPRENRNIEEGELNWLETHYSTALNLMQDNSFQTAVNALWGCRQCPRPSTQLAVLWSGIEALFGIQTELRFRISTLSALFLDEGKEGQSRVAKLYNARSKAIHEGKQPRKAEVSDSAKLLHSLIIKCVESGCLPNESALLFE